MTTPIFTKNDELQDFIEGHDDLSQLVKACKDIPEKKPSAELDAAILSQIEHALLQEKNQQSKTKTGTGTTKQHWKNYFSVDFLFNPTKHWQIPAGIAALLVMSVSWQMMQKTAEPEYSVKLAKQQEKPKAESVYVPETITPAVEERELATIVSSTPKERTHYPARKEQAISPMPKIAIAGDEKAVPPPSPAPILAYEPPLPSIAKVESPPQSTSTSAMASPPNNSLSESIADTALSSRSIAAKRSSIEATRANDYIAGRMKEAVTEQELAKAGLQKDTLVASKKMALENKAEKPAPVLLSKAIAPKIAIEPANSWLARIQEDLLQQHHQAALKEWEAFRLAYPEMIIPEVTLKELTKLQQANQELKNKKPEQ